MGGLNRTTEKEREEEDYMSQQWVCVLGINIAKAWIGLVVVQFRWGEKVKKREM